MQQTFSEVRIKERAEDWVPYYIGWFVMCASIAQLPVILAGARMLSIIPRAGWVLIVFTLPPALCLFLGGLGLIRRKPFGYFFVYAAVLFGGIGGFRVAIIPGLKQLLGGGLYVDDIALGTNLILVLILAYCHWKAVDKMTRAGRTQLFGAMVLLLLGLGSAAAGRAMVEKSKGTVHSLQAVPHVGKVLAQFQALGPLHYALSYTKWERSLTSVISGTATQNQIDALAAEHDLKPVPAERRARIHTVAKSWNLSAAEFPREFGSEDTYLFGRLKAHPRMVLLIAFRKSDNRFTAQLMGNL